MGYAPPIRRCNIGRGHVYEDANGRPIPGVTTIIGKGLPKPALTAWAARTVAEAAINRWDELAEQAISVRLKTLKDAPWADRDSAARRGTEVHGLAEALIKGERVTVPDELAGHVDSYLKFLNDWDPDPILVEAVIVNYTVGYAGTLDSVVAIDKRTLIIDIKTTRSGVYGEVAAQLAAYRYAEMYVDALGCEQPMIPVDGAAVLHVRSDGYSLIPVEAGPQQFRAFRYIAEVAKFADNNPALLGDELPPPAQAR